MISGNKSKNMDAFGLKLCLLVYNRQQTSAGH